MAILLAGILLTLIGLAGLVLPVVPGFLLILAGLWMIGKVFKHPLLEGMLNSAKRLKDGMKMTDICEKEKKGGLQ